MPIVRRAGAGPRPWLLAVLLPACLTAAAADPRPVWHCLPEETVLMARLPDAAAFLETLRTRTRLGEVLLGGPRLEKVRGLLVERLRADVLGGAAADDLEGALRRYGLEPDDLWAAFGHDLGIGMVMVPRAEDRPPLPLVLGWIEPGGAAAGRLLAAVKQRLEEVRDVAGAPRRLDVELAGHEVVWMVEPVTRIDVDLSAELGADDDATPEGVAERLERLQARLRDAPQVQTGERYSFVVQVGERLLFGRTLPPADAAVPAAATDFAATSGAEEARGACERFLAALADEGAGPLAGVLQLPALEALPAGQPLIEAVIDPRPLTIVAQQRDAAVARQLQASGLDAVGPLALRQCFAEGRLANVVALSLPAPRRGLLRILEQPCDACEVPSFVTRDAVGVVQISLDLAAAYEVVKELAVAEGGEQAANLFATVEVQAQALLGVELPRLLRSFGSRHWIVSYPPRVAEALAEARQGRADAEDDAAPQPAVADRTALVWQVDDVQPFLKILQQLAPAAGGQLRDEQGFRGLRLPNGMAAFAGRDHLVVAFDPESLDRTLAALRNPPADDAAFRASPAARRAGELVPLVPARLFAVGDASRTGGLLGIVREVFATMTPDDVPEEERDLLAAVQAVLPDAAEMEGMLGASATLLEVQEDGLVLRSIWELPAP